MALNKNMKECVKHAKGYTIGQVSACRNQDLACPTCPFDRSVVSAIRMLEQMEQDFEKVFRGSAR